MSRDLSRSTVVVTGASSGIGRAVAHAFGHAGANVVVAARRRHLLEEVVGEVERLGGQGLAVPTDVTDADAVAALGRRARQTFGGIDVWVNNAGVSLFARFEEAPAAEWRQVIETNLFGCVHGAREALRCFRQQGQGVLVNVGSIAGYMGQPYTSAYVASKFAIRALGECLREELMDASNIHVCTLLPASIDTPLFQNAANFTGRAVKPMAPVYDPRMVAAMVVGLARRPRREAFAGAAGRVMALQHALAPGLTERLMAGKVEKDHFQQAAAPPSQGNLFQPAEAQSGVDGGWRHPRERNGRIPMVLAGLALLALPLAVVGSRRAWG